jgi:hypothetical protein
VNILVIAKTDAYIIYAIFLMTLLLLCSRQENMLNKNVNVSTTKNSKMEDGAPCPLGSGETMIVRSPILASVRCKQTLKIRQRRGSDFDVNEFLNYASEYCL